MTFFFFFLVYQVALVVKNQPASAEDIRDTDSITGLGKSLEKKMITDSSILAWRIPWTVESDGPQSIEFQRVRQNWSNLAHANTHTHTHTHRHTHTHICLCMYKPTYKYSRKHLNISLILSLPLFLSFSSISSSVNFILFHPFLSACPHFTNCVYVINYFKRVCMMLCYRQKQLQSGFTKNKTQIHNKVSFTAYNPKINYSASEKFKRKNFY